MRRSQSNVLFLNSVRLCFAFSSVFVLLCLEIFMSACGSNYPRAVLPAAEPVSTRIQLKQVSDDSNAGTPPTLLESDQRRVERGDAELNACVAFLFARPLFRNSKLDVACINSESKEQIYRFKRPFELSDMNLREILTGS